MNDGIPDVGATGGRPFHAPCMAAYGPGCSGCRVRWGGRAQDGPYHKGRGSWAAPAVPETPEGG